MKFYNVKEIAEMLNTNPETVRRWIRTKKLDASIESKKSGHLVCEASLREFLKSSPKYAAIAKTSLGGAALVGAVMLPTAMIGGMISHKLIDAEQLKQARISTEDVISFLRNEIQKYTEAINAKEDTIRQLNKQIEEDQLTINEFKELIDKLSVETEDIL